MITLRTYWYYLMMNKKSLFQNKSIRILTRNESIYLKGTENILNLKIDQVTISYLPGHFSDDNISRPLMLNKETVLKIQDKHGEINPINLLINAHDWNIAIKDIDKTIGKICLIKEIPDSENILLIAAIRQNGYFILSHYEIEVLKDNQLKSLLGRGDVFRKDA